jgi:predicted molibdopterin-dependent oxidoreductase YjgC
MKKIALIFAIIVAFETKAQIFIGDKCTISFFSATKLENIDAVNTVTKPVFNTKNGTFAIKASQTAFTFKSAFMQEHYNENYVESEKFPYATFTGKVNETIDYTVNGKHDVTIKGNLDMHGVTVPREITGTIEIKDGTLIMNSKFEVKVADHKIKVPSLYVEKIAEIIQVTYSAELVAAKK